MFTSIRHIISSRANDRSTIVALEGNAFHGPNDVADALQRHAQFMSVFTDGIRAAESFFGDTPADDPSAKVRAGDPRYVQAALTLLAYIAYGTASEQGLLAHTAAFAGYSFGNYPLCMIANDVPIAQAVEGGYARGWAQITACTGYDIHPPYGHLYTVPNSANVDSMLARLNDRGPGFWTVAIVAPHVIALATTSSEVPDMADMSLTQKGGHPPYHHPRVMRPATHLFRAWFERTFPLSWFTTPTHVPLWVGRPDRVILCSGTIGDQINLITEDLSVPVSWATVTELFHTKNIVVLTIGDPAPKRSKLHVVSTPSDRKQSAPGTWRAVAV